MLKCYCRSMPKFLPLTSSKEDDKPAAVPAAGGDTHAADGGTTRSDGAALGVVDTV